MVPGEVIFLDLLMGILAMIGGGYFLSLPVTFTMWSLLFSAIFIFCYGLFCVVRGIRYYRSSKL